MYTKYSFLGNVVVTQGPTTSFGKRERTDGSEYSNGGATCSIYVGLCPSTKRCVALKLSKCIQLIPGTVSSRGCMYLR